MGYCSQLPSCARCGNAACSHDTVQPHGIPSTCSSYKPSVIYICSICDLTNYEHNVEEPHDIENTCPGFDSPFHTPPFQGGGGGFGGGGASVGW